MIEKPIGQIFKTLIIPVVETIAQEADSKPTTAIIKRNNVIISASYTIDDWDDGYLLSFTATEALNDLFSCEVDVTVSSETRTFGKSGM